MAAVLVLLLVAGGCGGPAVQRGDLYDAEIGLDYGYACDDLYIEDACEGLYGETYYETHKTAKRVKYKTVKAAHLKKNAAKISAFKTKAAENAAKAAKVKAAKKAQAQKSSQAAGQTYYTQKSSKTKKRK